MSVAIIIYKLIAESQPLIHKCRKDVRSEPFMLISLMGEVVT